MAISKKLRFDIFKRDLFKCQYCGRTPPEVILEIDHVAPKSQGGRDDINNFVTACFDCNRGRGKHPLSSIPDTLISNMEIAKERREQVNAYNRYLTAIKKARDNDVAIIGNL